MNSLRLFAAMLLLAGTGILGISASHAEISAGKDYSILPNPQPTSDGDKIEVIEFFWYSCPHCYELHPRLKNWFKRVPDDVDFRYIPAVFRPNWEPGAKTFYALEALGERDKLHDKVYDAIHRERIDLSKNEILFDWVAKQGIDRQKFVDLYNSFSVQNQAARAAQMSRNYGLSGVPSIVVDGRYLTSGRMGSTPEETIRIMEELIDKVRKERQQK